MDVIVAIKQGTRDSLISFDVPHCVYCYYLRVKPHLMLFLSRTMNYTVRKEIIFHVFVSINPSKER